ncbi:transcription elongation factor GreA [Paenibacillus sp. UNCCL117]|uniref:GreA/GreB family elongation factor n=1 Tax=unclassified Paenibacillus TaxID=185978 RepID=UPI00088BE874|nr:MULTISPECIES: GreA/GreB family elongation factor [unclassified Paenibacillus]SDD43462.1 transcription elongation factor GreA [Paenibacillus sp. cl123]SFW47365.1 transcription elongation factor GreA [Paenibacillus sp. UNCCL117]
MSLSPSFRSLREQYVRQVILLGDERNRFLDAYFPDFGNKRTQMGKLLSSYTHTLERLLASPDEAWPAIVLIGSRVTVTYLEDGISDTFTIVFPDESDPEQYQISFLSPVVEKLLLGKAGDILPVETNLETFHVRIDLIHPADEPAIVWKGDELLGS